MTATDDSAIPAEPSRPRLVYVVSEDWYFLSHRLPMARAAREAGFEVHVATRIVEGRGKIAAEGFRPHHIPFARGRLSLPASLATIRALRRLHRELRTDIVHHVSLQPTVLGQVATRGLDIGSVNALTGLGFAFASATAKAALVRTALRAVLRRLLNRPRTAVIVQNDDDRRALRRLGIRDDHIGLIAGSGVDIRRFRPLPEPDGPFTVAFVGRLLEDKGIRILVEAHRILRARGLTVRLLIAGLPDAANPASISPREVGDWDIEPGIHWLGHVEDISTVWAEAHVAVLPSRREGLPLSLLEAAACGRALIATDAPGCRDVVRPGLTGLLTPLDDAVALADAIAWMDSHPDDRQRFGAAARTMAEQEYAAGLIGQEAAAVYQRLMREGAAAS
ncbi:MAG TPA: glycosyltransferase family 4 protein [Xanthobacteraceae bacterium]|nr:glycosyltransferase family 4 protein [Xanthobacteraceae bacterium]